MSKRKRQDDIDLDDSDIEILKETQWLSSDDEDSEEHSLRNGIPHRNGVVVTQASIDAARDQYDKATRDNKVLMISTDASTSNKSYVSCVVLDEGICGTLIRSIYVDSGSSGHAELAGMVEAILWGTEMITTLPIDIGLKTLRIACDCLGSVQTVNAAKE